MCGEEDRHTLGHMQKFHLVLLRPRRGDSPGGRGEVIDGNNDFEFGTFSRERQHRRDMPLRDECDCNFGMIDT